MPQIRQHKQYMQRSTGHRVQRREHAPDSGVCLTREGIEKYLSAYRAEGYSEGTLQSYQCKLQRLYEDLPEDKTIRAGTLERWRETLIQQGYAPSTVNNFLSVGNTYLDFVGHREYQFIGQMKTGEEAQPELTRAEYLRLLQTARALGKEKAYLLVKLFGCTGLTVQELPKVTVEAVEEGKVAVSFNRVKSVVRIPEPLRRELSGYVRRNGYLTGPIFLTREGTPMSRTYVTIMIRGLCADAQVAEEKGNPRCLKRLYQSTRSGIESNIALLVEQALERQLELEQLSAGWEEV